MRTMLQLIAVIGLVVTLAGIYLASRRRNPYVRTMSFVGALAAGYLFGVAFNISVAATIPAASGFALLTATAAHD